MLSSSDKLHGPQIPHKKKKIPQTSDWKNFTSSLCHEFSGNDRFGFANLFKYGTLFLFLDSLT